ncbi:MAG: RND transporter [Rhodobacteraceae bacterium]|nr:RND transporter [Paracoccaceae bacterium]
MKILVSILDKISLHTLIVATIFLGIIPFSPPHSIEKIQMLMAGELTQWIDIGDLAFHLSPAVLLVLKIIRLNGQNKAE